MARRREIHKKTMEEKNEHHEEKRRRVGKRERKMGRERGH